MERRRGFLARAGVTLLNLLAPGVGLLRIGRLRNALQVYGVILGTFVAIVVVFAGTRDMTFGKYAILVSLAVAVTVATYAWAMWLTWQGSRDLSDSRPVWSRWYAIVGAIMVSIGANFLLTSLSHKFYHNFYLPSESMDPTLAKNDRILASMRAPARLDRGDLVLVKAPGNALYIKRIAGLPGDKVALRDGTVFINGEAVKTIAHGMRPVSYTYVEARKAFIYLEQFPGEVHSHLIQDLGQSDVDDFPEIKIAPGHVFVLGDNRDDSLDSRSPKELGGLEQVPLGDVIGRPLFFYWPVAKMGQSLRDK